jgi:Adenylate and Guanylate cyclase catalytic domain
VRIRTWPGPVTLPRAGALRTRYHALFADPELPVPVHWIAEDLLGLRVAAADLKELSGALYPAEREIRVNVAEPETGGRFTLAHELGHWVCYCLGGRDEPVFCRLAARDALAPVQLRPRRRAAVGPVRRNAPGGRWRHSRARAIVRELVMLPSGTVTLLFSGIEGSTKLLHRGGDAYAELLRTNRRLLPDAFRQHNGVEVDTEGDAFFVAFTSAGDAVAASRHAHATAAANDVYSSAGRCCWSCHTKAIGRSPS